MNTETNIIPFEYKDKPIRVVQGEDGEPLWVAKDVSEVLRIADHHQATEKLDDDERGRYNVPTPSGEQEMIVINESGLYTLIMRSNKHEAKSFRRWITHEVLPTLRKTGSYSLKEKGPRTPRNLGPIHDQFLTAMEIAELMGMPQGEAVLYANTLTEKATGYDLLDLMGTKERFQTLADAARENAAAFAANPSLPAMWGPHLPGRPAALPNYLPAGKEPEWLKQLHAERDHVLRFLRERCIAEPAARVPTKDLYAAYYLWCMERKTSFLLPKQRFGKRLLEMGYCPIRGVNTRPDLLGFGTQTGIAEARNQIFRLYGKNL